MDSMNDSDTPEDTIQLRWGYHAGIPAGTRTAWGARAIINQADASVDLLHDRQDAAGPDREVTALLEHLNGGVNTAWISAARALLRSGEMSTRVAREFTLHADENVTVKANTNASAGYLYVVAYPTPPTGDVAR